VLTGLDGVAQTATTAGVLASDEFRDAFGNIMAQIAGLRPRQGFSAMDEYAALPLRLAGVAARGAVGDIVYNDDTGLTLHDNGLGPDDEDCDPGPDEECYPAECEPGEPGELCCDDEECFAEGELTCESARPEWGWIPHDTGTETVMVWVDPPPRLREPVAVMHVDQFEVAKIKNWRIEPLPIDPKKKKRKPKPPPPGYDPIARDVQTLPFSLWDLKALLNYLGQTSLASRLP
jgi:hypothetical protein